ncbi:unnamed protein product [Arabis nemorensis]|uniref:Uncharacterized protein n=1 Tax=Arabis nemorensis TaxID=586526 RepID=A0A565AXL2_9BRAS|nr:unnamed protein product [Arabis nemorensis]
MSFALKLHYNKHPKVDPGTTNLKKTTNAMIWMRLRVRFCLNSAAGKTMTEIIECLLREECESSDSSSSKVECYETGDNSNHHTDGDYEAEAQVES